jgi:hypothetical protein
MQAQQQGITLITIPFWWDRSPQRCLVSYFIQFKITILSFFSLIATIKTIRPDLLSHLTVTASPIPLEMPSHFKQPFEFVEGIGEPITACFVNVDIDPTGWYDCCKIRLL